MLGQINDKRNIKSKRNTGDSIQISTESLQMIINLIMILLFKSNTSAYKIFRLCQVRNHQSGPSRGSNWK